MTDQELRQSTADIEELRSAYKTFRQNIAKVIIGQDETLTLLATGLICGGHMLMIGVPGLAKTLMVKGLAETLGWKFQRIQFTPDLMPADITGTEILQAEEGGTRRQLVFHKGPIFANLILADEINRTPPKTQAALLEAMQEKAVTVGGVTYTLSPPFIVVATQNPIEQEGTYPLPEAQLDRFMLSIHLDYPDQGQEKLIAAQPPGMEVPSMEKVGTPEDFHKFNQIIHQVPVADHVLEYAVSLAAATRPKQAGADEYIKRYVAWGVGPRCTQYLITAAKARALLDGRPAPEIDDVRSMILPVMRHRILLNYNAMGENVDVEQVLAHLAESIRPA